MKTFFIGPVCVAAFFVCGRLGAEDAPSQGGDDFATYGQKLRERAILKMQPERMLPSAPRPPRMSDRYPWKTGIVATIFWVGHAPQRLGNSASAWDQEWMKSYGGYDNPNPETRRNFIPIAFVPRQNPFYVALPYNDVIRGETKAEAKVVIPWFQDAFVAEGKSVCRDRWLAIRNKSSKICYAQWSDCGPYRSDHWQYVFGNERPKPNSNQGAGLNVSPAVRDFLGMQGTDVVDWKFVEFKDIPKGPWALHGSNNSFLEN